MSVVEVRLPWEAPPVPADGVVRLESVPEQIGEPRRAVDFTPEQFEMIGLLVTRLDRRYAWERAIVGVRELAELLDVHPSFVYKHWRGLGGFKLAPGKTAPIRFRLVEVDRRLAQRARS